MLKILINAYACSPHTGSEPGMGWNWCVYLAKHCELHIITEGEFKDYIDEAMLTLPQSNNLHFYYNSVSDEVRSMCWNQGDWRFYKFYKDWQYSTYQMALEIIDKEKIDIVHQLNMIGFREPGYLWKIKDIPFVWGPIGGLKQMPLSYLDNANLRMKFFSRLKNILNILQLKYDKRVNKALKSANLLISSIPDSYNAIKKHKRLESTIIPETGCFMTDNSVSDINRFESDEFNVMWVGKFDFRKQLPLALKSIAKTNNKKIIFHIYGAGSPSQENEVDQIIKYLDIGKQIVRHGSQPNHIVLKEMRKAQLFFFTSISEDTSTVVLESISNQLPVLCFDACGFGAVIDEKVGRKVPFSNPDSSIIEFAKELNDLEQDREFLKEMSINCKQKQAELSWDEKAIKTKKLYDVLLLDY